MLETSANRLTPIDLAPASWIWLPSQRTLPNTFVLFRRNVRLKQKPLRAWGWVTADSRYLLSVNGRRVQWGPAPCDPRWLDADPVDITPYLKRGDNVIAAHVLFYGLGDGTWPAGKPGFICKLDIELDGGATETVLSDDSWLCLPDRAHPPGQYKRWYLRCLQEVFDSRLHPYGWDQPGFEPDAAWLPAMRLHCPANKPPACGSYEEYSTTATVDPAVSGLLEREIPALREYEVPAKSLAQSFSMKWNREPDDWFDFRIPGAYTVIDKPVATAAGKGTWKLPCTPEGHAHCLTFELAEQLIGWPFFTIDAPAGTVVEVITQESHDPANPPWLDTHLYLWSRFICKGGVQRFENFDYESLRWMQLHVRNASGPVTISKVGVRRREFDWPNQPEFACGDPRLHKLMVAALNTLRNSAQETIVDGMGRERQQYSGDVGHQVHAVRYVFGENRLPARFLRTFSLGLTLDGYFLDCWPAWDRLARIMQRQVNSTIWGPLLDHGVQLSFDCWHHYWQTGDKQAVAEPYPRLLRFAEYLEGIRRADGLLPVEDIGVPAVWIDHIGFKAQRHKRCAFNLYTAAMLQHALAPLCLLLGDEARAEHAARLGREIEQAAVATFWSAEHRCFVDNLPWLNDEPGPRFHDRTLATAVLFGQCPGGDAARAVEMMAACPPEMGISYPANANWRLWALAKAGRIDAVIREFRTRWWAMGSVLQNNTIQEDWSARADSMDQWSHCAVSPLFVTYMEIAGIKAAAPGFERCEIRPQLGDLPSLSLTAHTVRGPITFSSELNKQWHTVEVGVPDAVTADVLLPPTATAELEELPPDNDFGLRRFRLVSGKANRFVI